VTHNSALEQAATPSRSWQGRQDARRTAPAGQERSGSPLLTAGVMHIDVDPGWRRIL
jgi:hypothetical protein